MMVEFFMDVENAMHRLFQINSKNKVKDLYRVAHMYLNDFVRLFIGHWVT